MLNAALRLFAVAVELAPIAKHPLGGGVALAANDTSLIAYASDSKRIARVQGKTVNR